MEGKATDFLLFSFQDDFLLSFLRLEDLDVAVLEPLLLLQLVDLLVALYLGCPVLGRLFTDLVHQLNLDEHPTTNPL